MLLKTQLEHLQRTTPIHKSIEPVFGTSTRDSYSAIAPLYKYEQDLLDYQNINRMTGGAINRNQEASRAVREHQKQLLNNRLNFIAQVQGRRVNQGYLRPREEENPLVFQQIKQLYLKLIEYLKNNNYQKDIVAFPQKIENILLNAGYYLSIGELDQINNYNATGLELTLSDLVQDIFDYKERNIYDTVRSSMKRLTKIIKTLKNFVDNTIEDRKQKLSRFKGNLENTLLDKAKVLEKQEKIEKEASERLKYDEKFIRFREKKDEEARIELEERTRLEAEERARYEDEVRRYEEEMRNLSASRITSVFKKQKEKKQAVDREFETFVDLVKAKNEFQTERQAKIEVALRELAPFFKKPKTKNKANMAKYERELLDYINNKVIDEKEREVLGDAVVAKIQEIRDLKESILNIKNIIDTEYQFPRDILNAYKADRFTPDEKEELQKEFVKTPFAAEVFKNPRKIVKLPTNISEKVKFETPRPELAGAEERKEDGAVARKPPVVRKLDMDAVASRTPIKPPSEPKIVPTTLVYGATLKFDGNGFAKVDYDGKTYNKRTLVDKLKKTKATRDKFKEATTRNIDTFKANQADMIFMFNLAYQQGLIN